MWERLAVHSLFSVLFGQVVGAAAEKQEESVRRAIGAGCITCGVIWLLCLFGERAIPPLAVLRQCFDESKWILGKLVIGLLALPVGFPVAYTVTRRRLRRKAQGAQAAGQTAPNPAQARARQLQRWYELVVGVLLWVWFWFFTPVRDWLEQSDQPQLGWTMGLLAVWLLLAALLGTIGGRIVYRLAGGQLRR